MEMMEKLLETALIGKRNKVKTPTLSKKILNLFVLIGLNTD